MYYFYLMRPRFAQLSPDEVNTLQEGHKHGLQFQFRSRCLCLLLSHQQQPVKWLKEHFQVSQLTIYNWLDAWEEKGLRGLYNQPGQGRKPILTPQDKATVTQHVEQHTQQLKLARQSLRTELNRDFSQKTLSRFLKSVAGDGNASGGA